MSARVRVIVRRRGSEATYAVVAGHSLYGVTLWRRRRTGSLGAVSVLAPVGRDEVPLQVVFGDWWRPERDG